MFFTLILKEQYYIREIRPKTYIQYVEYEKSI